MKQAKKKKNKKALTIRERKFLKGLMEGKSIAEAGRMAGFAESTIRSTIYGKQAKASIQKALKDVMEEQGLTDEMLIGVLKDGLSAEKEISFIFNKVAQRLGLAIPKETAELDMDFVSVPDHANRHKFLETALRLKGHLNKQGEGPQPEDQESLESRISRIKEKMQGGTLKIEKYQIVKVS